MIQVFLAVITMHFIDDRRRIRTLLFWCFIGGVMASAAMIVTGGVSSQFGRGTLGEFANPNSTALALSVSLICVPCIICYGKD